MDTIECAVIGAGVVGLAIARALARQGREVIVLEAETAIGTDVSARNSEVIHAGLYYPTGSLKAQLCVRGRDQLYAYCAERGIAHQRCGKLLVTTDDSQLPKLAAIRAQALANGVADLQDLSSAQAQALEPALRCTAAVLSPSTGIIDTHGLMLALLGDAEEHGAMLALGSPVLSGEVLATPDTSARLKLQVGLKDGDGPTFAPLPAAMPAADTAAMALGARWVINAAALHAPALAARIQGLPADQIPLPALCKGNYYTVAQRAPFSRLIYPMPDSAGLGVHVTLDLGGQMRFGPDVQWIDREHYEVDPARADSFYDAVRRYWPALADGALLPDYAGIRPKICGPGDPAADFRIDGPQQHGVAGLINLFGIESPGLTSCMALGEYVARLCSD